MKLSFSVTCARALRVALVATALLPVRSPAQTLEEALDSPPGWTWTTSATAADGSTPVPGGVWTGQTAVTHDGVDAARSGTLPLFGTAKLRTESITGPGTVIFWRRHGRAYEENPFAIVANGVNVGPFLPGGTWQPVAIDYPSGPGTLEFWWSNYDYAGTEPDNHAYVDEVAFVPTTGAPQFLPDPPPDLTVGEGYTIQPPIALLGEKPMMLETTPAGQTWTNSTTLEAPAPGSPPRHSGWSFGLEATPARSGTWTITASNALGSVTRTFNVTVVPAAPHSIWIDGPWSAWAGATVRLTAYPRGTAPFTYQWKKDGTTLTGKTDQTLEITGFSAADEGNYTVEVTNGLGSRESGGHSIVLGNDPPTLVSQSGNVDQALFGFDSLQVEVTGTPPFNTEWRKDGQVIESNNGVSDGSGWRYLLGDPSDTPGVYVFRSANGLGEVVSAPMVVQVDEGVGIAEGLDNTNVGWRYLYTGSLGWHRQTAETHDGTDAVALLNSDPTPLRTAVEGPAVVSFWWRVQDGTLDFSVDGTVAATLSSPGSDSGWQEVNVSLGAGWHELEWQTQSWTPAAWLDQFNALGGSGGPVIVSHPVGGNYSFGDPVTLSVTVTGTGPFDYRLFRDDDPTPVQEALGQTATTFDFTLFADFSTPELSPGDNLLLEVAAASSNGPLTYRWYRNGVLVQTGGTTFQRTNVTTADHGLYRVEVSDPYYTTSSQAQVTVSVLYYHLTVLPPVETNGFAVATAINNAGVVAGYWGSVGKVPADVSAVVWQNAVPTRMTPSDSSFNWSWSINNHGQAAGELGLDWGAQKGVVRWWPPYTTGVFDNLGYPTGATLMEFSRINDAGLIAATDTGSGSFGLPRFAYRYTTAGVWELLGSLTGATPLRGAVDRGWATALDINNAGVIVGNTYFQEAGLTETNNIPTQTTGWFFDPTRPGHRTAMDTLSPDLALSPTQPWGWIDSVNDLGDMAARRYGAGSPTKLFLIQANGTVTKLLERPPRTAVPDDESFNVDALNNRREMVGYYHVPDGQHAALIRSRGTPPGGTPSTLNDFELYDLNDLVLGGTGGYVLRLANDINDQGQIVGEMTRPGQNSVGFLLTPVPAYIGNQLPPVQLLPGGEVHVSFVGIPGRTYHIEVAPTVLGPWTRVATVVAGPTGLVEYQETPPPVDSRFYRMVE